MTKKSISFVISIAFLLLIPSSAQTDNPLDDENFWQEVDSPEEAIFSEEETRLLEESGEISWEENDPTYGDDPIPLKKTSATKLPQAVIDYVASREMRYHHYLWHNIRDKWLQLSNNTQALITSLDWAPPRPAKTLDPNGTLIAIDDNGSGEDFLYMHRWMIGKFNELSTQTNDPYGNVTGWKTLPEPGDPDWPVAENYTIPDNPSTTNYTISRKTDGYFNRSIRAMESIFTDPEQLRNMTLGQLGSRIEVTIHQWLHMRFSSNCTYGFRPPANRTLPDMDEIWDNPEYDWLGDTYASQVNRYFWMIHGWVDDRIEDWRIANNLEEIIWNGTWVGGPMSSFDNLIHKQTTTTTSGAMRGSMPAISRSTNDATDTLGSDNPMIQVYKILATEVDESSFADEVVVQGFWPVPEELTVSDPNCDDTSSMDPTDCPEGTGRRLEDLSPDSEVQDGPGFAEDVRVPDFALVEREREYDQPPEAVGVEAQVESSLDECISETEFSGENEIQLECEETSFSDECQEEEDHLDSESADNLGYEEALASDNITVQAPILMDSVSVVTQTRRSYKSFTKKVTHTTGGTKSNKSPKNEEANLSSKPPKNEEANLRESDFADEVIVPGFWPSIEDAEGSNHN